MRIHLCLRVYFEMSEYVSQSVHFMLMFVMVDIFVGSFVGAETAQSLFGGFSIGIGLRAAAASIVSLVAGVRLFLRADTGGE